MSAISAHAGHAADLSQAFLAQAVGGWRTGRSENLGRGGSIVE